jgi:hypothetical protein
MARVREILLPWDTQPQQWTGVDGEGLGAGLRRAINGAVNASVEQAERSPITSLSGGVIDSPIVAAEYGLAVRLDNTLYNGIVQTPGWTDRTGEASFCLIFDRDSAGDASCWELGGGSGDEFPFSAKAYFDVAWTSRWGNAVNPPSGASFADRVILHFCVKNGEQRAYWNGQLWHSNTATGGFGIPATLAWAKSTLKGKFYGGFGWERFLSSDEVAAHYALPWSALAQQTIYIPVSAGGGTPTLLPSGISSLEAFGTASISVGPISVLVSGISSSEAFGTHVLSNGSIIIVPSGIASLEAFGTAILDRGTVIVSPNGISTAEAFGTASALVGTLVIYPNGISSAELFGIPAITGGTPSLITSVFYVRGFSAFGSRRNS